jgi:hypothetical protein
MYQYTVKLNIVEAYNIVEKKMVQTKGFPIFTWN